MVEQVRDGVAQRRDRGGDPQAAAVRVGWNRVRLGQGVTLGPGQALTLNGIAQGYAADRVRDVLGAAGYGPALIDMGEFAAIGGSFRLAIEDPDLGRIGMRSLTGGAIATSSPAAMRVGGAFHILGPQGQSARWSTVSVQAESAALADGLSTAFCLMDATAIRETRALLSGVGPVLAVDMAGDVVTI